MRIELFLTIFVLCVGVCSARSTYSFYTYENVRLLNHFEVIDDATVTSCKQECNSHSDCHACSLNENKCYLFKEGSYYADIAQDWTSFHPDTNLNYTKTFHGLQLHSSLRLEVFAADSVHECWLDCVNSRSSVKCVAVSFDEGKMECYKFAQNLFMAEKEWLKNWTTVSREEENLFNNYVYQETGVSLWPAIRTFWAYNELRCANECGITKNCDAISFSPEEKLCMLVKSANSIATRNESWNSYLVHYKPNVLQYSQGIRLLDASAKFVKLSSAEDCWFQCQRTVDCVAVTFIPDEGSQKGRCFKFNNPNYTAVQDKWSMTIAPESQSRKIQNESLAYENAGIALYNEYDSRMPRKGMDHFDCVRECNEDPSCGAVSVRQGAGANSSKCSFFKAGDFYGQAYEDFTSYTKWRQFSLETVVRDAKLDLIGAYATLKTRNEHICWVECQKRRDEQCAAVKYENKQCSLYRRGEYRGEVSSRSSKVIALKSESIVVTTKMDGFKMIDHFATLSAESAEQCWRKCESRRSDGCDAASFDRETTNESANCFLHKGTKQIATSDSNWTSIRIDYSEQPAWRLYNATKLVGANPISSSRVVSKNACWAACENDLNCMAVTFSKKDSRCSLFVDGTFSQIKDENSQTLARFDVEVLRRKDVKLVQPYQEKASVASTLECWKECHADDQCGSILYLKATKICRLYKKESFTNN